MEAIFAGINVLFTEPMVTVVMIFGIFMGIVFGSIPGLTATLGVMLMIPFTFTMPPTVGLSLLVAIYVGGISGGLITATLINIPGTPASLTTCWDGYPMAKKGKPGEALAIGVYSSLVGGTLSAIALFGIAPQLARVALYLGNWEYFTVCLLGLCIVSAMTGENVIKGLLGAVLGLICGSVGMDMLMGIPRLTFGFWQLTGGIGITALMMGFFAIGEICDQVVHLNKPRTRMNFKKVSFIPPFKEMKDCGPVFLLGSVIGTCVGILPGIGQTPAAILAYNQAKKISKHPERFGHGSPEGIVASEVTNNATNGGALIPLITLGIPGDGVTAALIGGLMIHGLQPGPLLFVQVPDVVGTIMVVYFLSNIVMYVMELGLMKAFVKMVNVRSSFLFPAIIVFCLLGIFALNNRIFDIWVMIIFGIIGYVLKQLQVDLISLLLGFVLGPLVEVNFKRALIAADGQLSNILTRPVAVVFLLISILFLFWPLIKKLIRFRRA
jgi:putative tricarboxylic transport membrane protein